MSIANTYSVRAQVLSQGEPVAFVNVAEINTAGQVLSRAQTDANGRFRLFVTSENALIKISHVGFEDQVLTAKNVPATLELFVENNLLDEVVIGDHSTSSGWIVGIIVSAILFTALAKRKDKKPKKVTL